MKFMFRKSQYQTGMCWLGTNNFEFKTLHKPKLSYIYSPLGQTFCISYRDVLAWDEPTRTCCGPLPSWAPAFMGP